MKNYSDKKRFSKRRQTLFGGLLLGAFIFGASLAASAQSATELKAQKQAWKTFQSIVARNDKTAITKMMTFPFEGSIVGGQNDFKVETAADFIKHYGQIFTAARRRSIARGKISPTDDEEFNFEMYENGAYHVFTFRKVEGVYKLVGTMAAG